MSNVLEYRGYFSSVQYSAEDHVLHGKIEGIRDLVNFESPSAEEIETEFHAAVDDYLQMCEALGREPDKAYSGSFNVRISPELHRELKLRSLQDGVSLNRVVERAVESYLSPAISYPSLLSAAVVSELYQPGSSAGMGTASAHTAALSTGYMEKRGWTSNA